MRTRSRREGDCEPLNLVTGGNKGIGCGLVKGLCEKFQGTVYLTARDVTRGESAVAELKKLGLAPVFHQLDINDQKSIDDFKNYIQETHGGLDILINNAAIAYYEDAPEPFDKQAEAIISVNYFSTLKFCECLFPFLRKNARVVNMSSCEGHLSKIPSAELRSKLNSPGLTIPELSKLMEKFIQDVKNNTYQEEGWGSSSYAVSKVGLSALTKIQQREFDKETPYRNIAINSVHPGYVDTDMTCHKGVWTVEQGVRAPLFAALEAENVKGQYIWADATVTQWDSDKPKAPY